MSKSQILEITFSAFIAGRAVKRMVKQDELQYRLPALFDLFAVGMDHHSGQGRCGTGDLKLGSLLDFNVTYPAGPDRLKFRVPAERRNLDT